MFDYWLDLIVYMKNMIHPFLRGICGKRYLDGEDIAEGYVKGYIELKDGEKCGGIILNFENELKCGSCGAFFGNARKKDKKQGEQGLIALLEEVVLRVDKD